ncbi:MAG: glucose-6-phosphate isomerase [Rhodobacter sp.]|nr:glucose-6-phosphate isomerase [Rhodobacter sp.]
MALIDLLRHAKEIEGRRILSLFDDPGRAGEFSVRACDMLLDYSKTNIDAEARAMLLELAEEAGLAARRAAMFSGAKINETEGRAVLHTALRNVDGGPVSVDGVDVMPGVRATLERMAAFAEAVRAGTIHAPGGGIYSDIVNIGIGGSDLGPAMAVQALAPYHDGPRCHFVSNVDGAQVRDVLTGLNPASTLVIVASKTFTTVETMTNAGTARDWIAAKTGAEMAGGHFVALSSNLEKTAAFGISPERVFGFEDWVGGRYSVWGPIGLSLMLAVGPQKFDEFLSGGAAMDAHFREAETTGNMPLMLALVGLWHNQVLGHATRAVLPYEQRLARLPAYLQQLEMESNGKRVSMDGTDLGLHSGPVVWGEPGTNGQHAFYQLIHQGTRVVPCEFMVAREGHEPDLAHQHRLLTANCLAQSEALLRGRTLDEAKTLLAGRFEGAELERQARHRVFPGNRPSVTLVYDKLTPKVLGQIVALYEHRVFVEGVILGINSFDQWGVELGKELALALEPVLAGKESAEGKDGSTRQLVEYLSRGR